MDFISLDLIRFTSGLSKRSLPLLICTPSFFPDCLSGELLVSLPREQGSFFVVCLSSSSLFSCHTLEFCMNSRNKSSVWICIPATFRETSLMPTPRIHKHFLTLASPPHICQLVDTSDIVYNLLHLLPAKCAWQSTSSPILCSLNLDFPSCQD